MSDIEISVPINTSKLLLTVGKWCNDNIVVSVPDGESLLPDFIVENDHKSFNITVEQGNPLKLLTAGKYCDRNIKVTGIEKQPFVTLDISNGTITITDTGYSQGENAEIPWGENTKHEITITGTSEGSNNIVLQGGNPIITLKNINMTVTAATTPGIILYGGTGAGLSRAVNAVLVLRGENSIFCNNDTPVQININAVLTIQGSGSLYAESDRGNTPAIGCGDNNQYAYNNSTGNAAKNNAYRSTGNLVIKGGIINAVGNGRGTNQRVAAIGDSYYANFGKVSIEGGTINLSNNDLNGTGISGDYISISGGLVNDTTGGARGGIHTQNSFEMSSGTIRTEATLTLATTDTTVAVTGGNIGTLFTGEILGRTRTKISFINTDGSPISDTEIFVSEGDNEWSAITDFDGVVYTYLASETTVIRAGLKYDQKSDVFISGGEGVFTKYK